MSTTFNHMPHSPAIGWREFWKCHHMISLLRIMAVAVLAAFIWLLAGNQPFKLGSVTPLSVFWKVVVPLVPMILLVAPALWRNICPLAFFNILGHRLRNQLQKNASYNQYRIHSQRHGMQTWLARYGLYFAMFVLLAVVPARILLFNSNSYALVVLLLSIAAGAFVLGFLWPYKSGWCSSICPVYPVENAYGASPLIFVENTLCQVAPSEGIPQLFCGGCTRQCLDLKMLALSKKTSDAKRHEPVGVALSSFISAFPGFVLAYLILAEVTDFHALAVLPRVVLTYGTFALCMAVSASIYLLIRHCLVSSYAGDSLNIRRLNLTFTFAAFSIYYFMAGPAAVNTVGALLRMSDALYPTAIFMLFVMTTLVGWLWLRRAW